MPQLRSVPTHQSHPRTCGRYKVLYFHLVYTHHDVSSQNHHHLQHSARRIAHWKNDKFLSLSKVCINTVID